MSIIKSSSSSRRKSSGSSRNFLLHKAAIIEKKNDAKDSHSRTVELRWWAVNDDIGIQCTRNGREMVETQMETDLDEPLINPRHRWTRNTHTCGEQQKRNKTKKKPSSLEKTSRRERKRQMWVSRQLTRKRTRTERRRGRKFPQQQQQQQKILFSPAFSLFSFALIS